MNTNWSFLLESLTRVERLGAHDTGAYSFGLESEGAIFVEHGRICWIAARGLERRLRDLLSVDRPGDRFNEICARCRAEGLLLGETLVAEGFLAPGELERALRRHSAECLRFLSKKPHRGTWRVHASRGYSPSFTFLATEVFFEAIAQRYPEERGHAEAELTEFNPEIQQVVAYLLPEGGTELLPLAHQGESSLAAMRDLGGIASALLGAGHELGSELSFILSTTPSGDGILIWRRSGLFFVLHCDDRPSLARATARCLREN